MPNIKGATIGIFRAFYQVTNKERRMLEDWYPGW